MFRHYLMTALRNVGRQKGYSFLNISGLALGMACTILIVLYVHRELSYDRFHANADRIFRVTMEGMFGGEPIHMAVTPDPLAAAIVSRYPEVAVATRVLKRDPVSVRYADRDFTESEIVWADPALFEVFTFPLIQGDPKTALSGVGNVVLTESAAQRYFGTENPMGETIRFENRYDYVVTGVIQDIPQESHLRFELACSLDTYYYVFPRRREDWLNTINGYTYLRLNRSEDRGQLERKLPELMDEKLGRELQDMNGKARFRLQPLTDVHLKSKLQWEFAGNSDVLYVYVFASIAGVILAIACMNFMNLATARSARRALEVGLKKVVGARRRDLLVQFLAESTSTTLLALTAALIIVKLALPLFHSISGIELALGAGEIAWLLPMSIALALAVGLLAGSYPAAYLSSFQPVRILKGGRGGAEFGAGSARFRRFLVVGQFVLSTSLMIGTLIIGDQIRFMKGKDLGFQKDQILAIRATDRRILNSPDQIKSRLKEVPGVVEVTATTFVPGQGQSTNAVVPEGAEGNSSVLYRAIDADADFVRTMGMQIVQGRDFSKDMPFDTKNSILINETAARKLGWKDPIGKTMRMSSGSGDSRYETKTIVGVVRDFHYSSLRDAIEPLYINNEMRFLEVLAVKLKTDQAGRIVGRLKKAWETIFPGQLFDYFFLDESFDAQYRSEERLNRIFCSFTVLAIAIACLGLFGLASYMAERRTKEVGIRKVLGATVGQIVKLLSSGFISLVGLAVLIAWPIAFFAMRLWLQEFAFRTPIGPWTFLSTGMAVLTIAFLTVSWQAVRAARANPADTLKST